MSPARPAIVALTQHAERRISERGLSVGDVAELVLTEHLRRRRNPGEADWLVRGSGLAVAYNWPDGDDETMAVVITAWRE